MIKKIGRYQIVEELGKGAMGVVYKAHDPMIDRILAIKLIKLEPVSFGALEEEIRSRFLREARSAGTLSHPNIVTIYDVGEDRKKAYIAMEYIEGKTLSQLIVEGKRLSYQQILNIFVQISGALDYAHNKGIIHRDIKPANIMLTNEGRVKLCDFGIAKIASSHTTQTGIVMGTPCYMSPEQIKGEKIDGRSDIFSLGIVLYELLSGDIPFKGETTSIMYKIVHVEPAPPKLIMKTMPEFYNNIMRKVLAKNPDDRYKTCSEFARALKLYQLKYLKKKKTKKEPIEEAKTVAFTEAEVYSLSEDEKTAIAVDSYQPLPEESEVLTRKLLVRRSFLLALLFILMIAGANYYGLLNWERLQMASSSSLAQSLKNSKAKIISHLFQKKLISKNLYITSEPSGAAIFTNGADTGLKTPANLNLSGEKGEAFSILMKKDSCYDTEKRLVLNQNTPEKLNLTLRSFAKEVIIDTQPPGADIKLDDKELSAKTPAKAKLEYGRVYKLTLMMNGYYDKIIELSPQELDEKITYQLEAFPEPGFLLIKGSYPVDIYLGKKLIAQSVFNKRVNLPAGTHSLTIVNKDFLLNLMTKAKVASQQTAIIALPPLGKINIRAIPSNCKIYIDGIFLDYPPIFDRRIVAGRHKIKYLWPDGKKKIKPIEVPAGKSAWDDANIQEASQ